MRAATEQKASFKKPSSHFWLGASSMPAAGRGLTRASWRPRPGTKPGRQQAAAATTPFQPLLVSASLGICFSAEYHAVSDLPSYRPSVLDSRRCPGARATEPRARGGSGSISPPRRQLVRHPSPALACRAQRRCRRDDICRDVCSPSAPAPRHRRKRRFSFHIRSDGRGTRNPHWHRILHFLFE